MTTVTVVLPSIRWDEWLEGAIVSVDEQSIAKEIELVLVCDGYQPPARALDRWQRIGRARVVTIPTRSGLANALNVGLDAATSDTIARLDADDTCRPGRIEIQRSFLEAHPNIAAVGSAATLINSSGETCGKLPVPTDNIAANLTKRNSFVHSSMMMRKSAVVASGGYTATMRQFEDYELWLRLCLESEMANLPMELVRYRIHEQQMSRASLPFTPYTRAVLGARRALARKIGKPRIMQFADDRLWIGAQVARSLGLRAPGYTQAKRGK